MNPVLAAALLAATLSPAFAQTAPSVSPAYSGPGVYHTGPRYCPELAHTGHPFAAVCPSVQEAIGRVQSDIRTDLQITPVAPDGEEQAGAPIRSNGRRYEQ